LIIFKVEKKSSMGKRMKGYLFLVGEGPNVELGGRKRGRPVLLGGGKTQLFDAPIPIREGGRPCSKARG